MNIRQTLVSLSYVLSSACLAQALPIEPFADWSRTRPNWTKDPSEVAYVATRCGALYSPIGSIMAERGSTQQLKEAGEDLTVRGLRISIFGFQLARDSGWAAEIIRERQQFIAEIYWKIISSNRTIHNNMFYGFIENDFKFCSDFERVVRDLASAVRLGR